MRFSDSNDLTLKAIKTNTNFPNISTTISPNQLLATIPGNLYWKDINGCYLGCNHTLLNILGFHSTSEIIGKHDNQILIQEYYEDVIRHDQLVIPKRNEQTFYEHGYCANKKPALYLSKKIPLYDTYNELIGLMGISFDITDRVARNSYEAVVDDLSDSIILNPLLPKLSLRQQQCLNYLLRGMSAKSIAAKLKLSVRTVESHIDCLKGKFNCNKKADLINKILSMGCF